MRGRFQVELELVVGVGCRVGGRGCHQEGWTGNGRLKGKRRKAGFSSLDWRLIGSGFP